MSPRPVSAFELFVDEPRWVAWHEETRGKDGKPTKVPYSPRGGKAKADKPETWGSRAAAERAAARLCNGHDNGGIGIELGDLGSERYLAGVDLDSCIDNTGCLALWAEKLLTLLPTYAEISPSGSGLKAFFYCATKDVRPFLEMIGITDSAQWGVKRAVGQNGANHGPGIEIYFSHRYFAVTERLFPGQPDRITTLDRPALERLAQLIPPPKTRDTKGVSGAGGDSSRSAIAFSKGCTLRRAGKTFEQMVEALRDDPETADWVREKGMPLGMRELRRIWNKATPVDAGVSLDDFYAYMPDHSYIFAPTREMWPAASVNARIAPMGTGEKEIKASAWLDQNSPVEQMTWAPGLPMIIPDRLISEGGWIDRPNVRCFNLYRPPVIKPGRDHVDPWLDHLGRVFPDDVDHIVNWLAHRVQHPEEKINHALVFGGHPGIGKDTILEPVKHAVGPWNFAEASPTQMLGRFNGFLKSVILRISEARDLGDSDRFKFYDHMKAYTAAPPDVLRVDEKHLREHAILNCVGVIITTNHKTDGIYLPADDRRHYVAWSELTIDDFDQKYWNSLYAWYNAEGSRNVAVYLAALDLSGFNPKAPPQKTTAFWEIVDASRVPEDSELADLLEGLDYPDTVTLQQLIRNAIEPFKDWLADRRNSRLIPHRLEECGYVAIRCTTTTDGRWKVDGKNQVVYAKASLSIRERYIAASARVGRNW